jgi:hypothetical protein
MLSNAELKFVQRKGVKIQQLSAGQIALFQWTKSCFRWTNGVNV